jgi:hypothetical protein
VVVGYGDDQAGHFGVELYAYYNRTSTVVR